MSVHGPQFNPLYRVEPVDYTGREEDELDKKRKKRVTYQGRQWMESKEELPLEDRFSQKKQVVEDEERKKTKPLVIERMLLDKAHSFFERLTTLEDKIAQLCFYKTEASYDPKIQTELMALITNWQLGGVVFFRGSYKREAYLINHYQEFSKLPLLIGNDFLHNLSFYFNQEPSKKGELTLQHYRDLGKAIMGQNRSLGVHFLFDREALSLHSTLSFDFEQKKSFRKGIRQAHGVVARDLSPKKSVHTIDSSNINLLSSFKGALSDSLKNENTQQFIGMRTLFLQECATTDLLQAFKEGYEAFLIESNLEGVIATFVQAIREGHISEEELNKRVLKILMIKAYFQG